VFIVIIKYWFSDVLGGEPKDGGSDSEDEDSENKVAEIRFIPEDNRICMYSIYYIT